MRSNPEKAQKFNSKTFRKKLESLHPSEYYDLSLPKYHYALLSVGVDKFMSTAVQFCENESRKGTVEIVSIGSGQGGIEEDITAAYRDRFGTDLNITFVDPDPSAKRTFRNVDHLIRIRPELVGNCVSLLDNLA